MTPPKLITSYRGYNIVQCGSDLIAVNQALGEVRLYEERLGERNLGSIILRDGTVDQLKSKIDTIHVSAILGIYGRIRAIAGRSLRAIGWRGRVGNAEATTVKWQASPQPPLAIPQPPGSTVISPNKVHMDEDFLQYAFHDDPRAIAIALMNGVGDEPQSFRLIGSSPGLDTLRESLEARGHTVARVPWSLTDPIPEQGLGMGILCDTPKTFDEWRICKAVIADGNIEPIWQRVLPLSLFGEMLRKYEYNATTLEELIKVYRGRSPQSVGRRSNAQLDRIQQYFPLRGKTVIEFGPSDGNRTADLLALGPAHVLAVEGRPENVIKLLVAKHVMGWDNLDIEFDNFQLPGAWAKSRYDFAYAQGVYYHCQNPLLFLDLLTQLSDVIFIGGWAASEEKPPTPWLDLEQDGIKYRGKIYSESYHFLSGLGRESYMLKASEIERFLGNRGFLTRYCEVTVVKDSLGTDWIELLAVKK